MAKPLDNENFFDFLKANMGQFAMETVLIDDKRDKAMRERSLFLKTKIVCKNTGLFGLTFGLVMGGLVMGGDKIINPRKLAHACPDLKNEIKLIESIAGNAQKLKIALKQMVFDQKNGH